MSKIWFILVNMVKIYENWGACYVFMRKKVLFLYIYTSYIRKYARGYISHFGPKLLTTDFEVFITLKGSFYPLNFALHTFYNFILNKSIFSP